ncbi:hypothetical protein [Nocardia thraciensis]
MPVRYVRVNPVVDLFTPVIRATGNLVVIGKASAGTEDAPAEVVSPSNAAEVFGPPAGSELTTALQLAFQQTPGPSRVWGIRYKTDPAAALTAAENLDVQFVALANTPLADAAGGAADKPIGKLVAHVVGVSNTGGDGKERMGVVMLAKGSDDPAVVSGTLANSRMVYVAHNSAQDAAVAVAGTIAGYPPSTSMLLKQVAITSPPFTAASINKINGSEDFGSPPNGNGVNWLTTPALIPGTGVYLGEGYTGNKNDKKYIDVVRTVDDVTFKLKARMINAIGSVRISRSGLRAMVLQLESVLNPLVAIAEIDSYDVTVPLLPLLDADPATLTPAQDTAIKTARNDRRVEFVVTVKYAGAVHRIDITLKFT